MPFNSPVSHKLPNSMLTLLDTNPANELEQLLNSQIELPVPLEGSQFHKYLSRKSDWEPATYDQQQLTLDPRGLTDATLRCLALALALEIPVGEYTLAASQREFTNEQRWALLDNASDELVHFTALRNFAMSLPGECLKLLEDYQLEALHIAKTIEDCVEHPIVKSGYIELSVFLAALSLMRKFGKAPMKILVGNISRDESVHVQTNWSIIDSQNIPYTDSKLNRIRQEIVYWMSSPIKTRKWNTDFWLEQSDRLMNHRRADGLKFTSKGMSVAFFEVSNSSLAAY